MHSLRPQSPNISTKRIIHFLSFVIILCACILISSCSKRSSDEPLVLDSAYVENYMAAHKMFKNKLYWAQTFYKKRNYELAWFKDDELNTKASQMLSVVEKVGEEGLDPKRYNVITFDSLFKVLKTMKKDEEKKDALKKEIDLALSATYFNWAADYYRGLIPRKKMHATDWDVKRNSMNLATALASILDDNPNQLPYANFQPMHPEYKHLKEALQRYRKIEAAGGWPQIPANARLTVGAHSPIVAKLCKRLEAWKPGQTLNDIADKGIFTPELKKQLRLFQKENGLAVTGMINSETLNFMNKPVQDRIRQIIINMERWRWIPEQFKPEYLIVNIPEYRLRIYRDKQVTMAMNVIVGKDMHNTPIFNDEMVDVVLAPYWNIPPGILKREIAPKAAADPNYINTMNMEVVDRKGQQIPPETIDWAAVQNTRFPYTLRRKPGPKNDLGRVKFVFPNSRNIYLHDTPSTQLFSATQRTFSHGCVRVEKPIELAEYLLKDSGWTKQRIEEQIEKNKQYYVRLKKKLPVYLVYFTAAADNNGTVRFFHDIYEHDAKTEQIYFGML